LRLLNRRAALALAIAEQKARSNSGVYAPAREKGVLARLGRANRGPLPESLVRAIFREIISASRSLEQRLRIAYLGPEATYAHLAARQQFGAAADYLPAASVAEVFHDVEKDRADLGVVPVENSTEGMVAHTLDLLADSPLAICAEIAVPVRHNLLPRAPPPPAATGGPPLPAGAGTRRRRRVSGVGSWSTARACPPTPRRATRARRSGRATRPASRRSRRRRPRRRTGSPCSPAGSRTSPRTSPA